MRLLYFSSLFPSPTQAHLGPFALRRAQALAALGASVHVVRPVGLTPPLRLARRPRAAYAWFRRERSLPRAGSVEGLDVSYPRWVWPPKKLFGGLEAHLQQRQIAAELDRIVAYVRPDAVVASWLPDVAGACLAARRHGLPVIGIAEGSDVAALPERYPWWRQMRGALSSAALVFVSDDLRRQAPAAGLPDGAVVHNGVDTDLFSPGPAPGRPATILTVGWHSANKDQATLLRAVAQLRRRGREVRVVLVGEGPLRAELVAVAERLGLGGAVDFLAPRPQPELVPLYRAADVFCLPSRNEGLGCVLLEAMACGVPVVASDVGGIPEVVSPETSVLVPPADPELLAAGLERALDRRWSREAIRAHVVDRFTWRHTGERLLEVVETVARG